MQTKIIFYYKCLERDGNYTKRNCFLTFSCLALQLQCKMFPEIVASGNELSLRTSIQGIFWAAAAEGCKKVKLWTEIISATEWLWWAQAPKGQEIFWHAAYKACLYLFWFKTPLKAHLKEYLSCWPLMQQLVFIFKYLQNKIPLETYTSFKVFHKFQWPK